MPFSSIPFLFYFLPIFLAAYFIVPGIFLRNVVTLAFSLVFYAWGEPRFLPILLMSIAFNAVAALMIDAAEGRLRALWLAGAVGANVALLANYKYAGFLVENLDRLLPTARKIPPPDIPLPLGISFFTFHCLSYVIDVYRRRFPANRNPIEIALYIALFPQLIAGPIVRYKTIARQLRARRHTLGRASEGARIFIVGLAQKVLVADQVGPLVEAVFDKAAHPNFHESWLGLLAYTIQIYFDFAGYSNMAIGIGICLGFTLPRNFRLPYTSGSITEFWRRWHMSLSSWMRDYLYIPLGGNRGTPARTYRNLVTVFLLCGLWHGASWNFVLWGAWHGGFLVLERAWLRPRLARWPLLLPNVYAMLVVMGGWVLFRARDLSAALDVARGLVGANGGGDLRFDVHMIWMPSGQLALIAGWVLAIGPRLTPAIRRLTVRTAAPYPSIQAAGEAVLNAADFVLTFGLLALCMMVVASGAYSPFLYFRF